MKLLLNFILLNQLVRSIPGQTAAATPVDNSAGKLNVSDFVFIEKELVQFNLFRTHGDWVLRAISDKNQLFTEANVELHNNIVTFKSFLGEKLFTHSVLSHDKDRVSKIILSNDVNNTNNELLLGLYQDDNIVILLIVGQNNKRTLRVLVRSSKTSTIDDQFIRQLIHNLMAKHNIQRLIKELVNQLVFVNSDIPGKGLAAAHLYPIGENDLVDCDMTAGVGNWTYKATSSEKYSIVTHAFLRLLWDKIFMTLYNGDKSVVKITMEYLENSRLIYSNVMADNFYDQGISAFLYIEDDFFINLVKLRGDEEYFMNVLVRIGAQVDPEYINKVIDKNLLFNYDIKRAIKHLAAKLKWR